MNKTADAQKAVTEYLQKPNISDIAYGNLKRLNAMLSFSGDNQSGMNQAMILIREAIMSYYKAKSKLGIELWLEVGSLRSKHFKYS